MESTRKIIKNSLSKFFKKNVSVNYEESIYKMAVKIYGDDLTPENYSSLAYDKLGQLVSGKDDNEVLKKILQELKEEVVWWDASVYDTPRENYKKILDTSVLKPKAVKGMYKCNKKGCGSDTFYIWSQQIRAADEGMTQFRQCSLCGIRGREN